MKGDFVLISFPYTSLLDSKLRPSLIIHEDLDDVVAVYVTSQIESFNSSLDIRFKKTHPEFRITGLKNESVIKLDKIMTVEKRLVAGGIGTTGSKIRTEFNSKFSGIYRL